MTDALKALRYAEDQLGVHTVYDDAKKKYAELDDVLSLLATAKDTKRDLEFRLADREQELAISEYSKHPDMAQTRMDKHIKQTLYQDDTWRELREQIGKANSDIEGFEFDRSAIDVELKVGIARMHELGGLLQYLAVIKSTDNSRK